MNFFLFHLWSHLLIYIVLAQNQLHSKTSIKPRKRLKIAIIGGGVSGSFLSKYLADYDLDCQAIDSITIFDPYTYMNYSIHDNSTHQIYPHLVEQDETSTPFGYTNDTSTERLDDRLNLLPGQGGRVATLIRLDGSIVDLGASIIFQGNQLVMEMIQNDPTLEVGEPHHGSNSDSEIHQDTSSSPHGNKDGSSTVETQPRIGNEYSDGWGIFNGFLGSSWPLYISSQMSSFQKEWTLLWRYHYDLFRIKRATDRAYQSFSRIYELLDDTSPSFIQYRSPDDIWKAVGLWKVANISFDDLLNQLGFSSHLYNSSLPTYPFTSWVARIFQRIFGGIAQGRSLLRYELLTAINLANNNKGNEKMNGLAGMVNFLASKGSLFSIVGGNYKLIQSAIQQADEKRKQSCSLVNSSPSHIVHIPVRVKTVISEAHNSSSCIDLYDQNGKSLGDSFDVVVLAAPLQFANIDFLVKGSLFDPNVLYSMPVQGRIMVDEDQPFIDANVHGHLHAIRTLPPSAQRPYTQVITTVIQNATLQTSFLKLDEWKNPSSIIFTEKGKKALNDVSAIRRLDDHGSFKIFSSSILDSSFLRKVFGDEVNIEYVKVWGGMNGGATPDFNGGKSIDSPPFLLFDSTMSEDSVSFDGSTVYYTNTMETAVSALEISAIGAKAVAKLIASRYAFLRPEIDGNGYAAEL